MSFKNMILTLTNGLLKELSFLVKQAMFIVTSQKVRKIVQSGITTLILNTLICMTWTKWFNMLKAFKANLVSCLGTLRGFRIKFLYLISSRVCSGFLCATLDGLDSFDLLHSLKLLI